MPGPMVVESATLLTYVPLAVDGLRRQRAHQADQVLTIWSAVMVAFPMPAWTMPAFSTLKSTDRP
jgi:hypothetical protein